MPLFCLLPVSYSIYVYSPIVALQIVYWIQLDYIAALF